ncbi:MAG: histidinol dehydrogenase, partial [Anaerolineales bacterium]
MLRIFEAEIARQSILKRIPPDEFDVPQSVLDGIEMIFGERLSPSEAVRLIIKDVRTRGDEALQEWSTRLDGATLSSFRV